MADEVRTDEPEVEAHGVLGVGDGVGDGEGDGEGDGAAAHEDDADEV